MPIFVLMGAILFLTLLTIIYTYIVYRYTKEFRQLIRPRSFLFKAGYFIALLLPGLILWSITHNEQYIYFFDYADFWQKCADFQQSFYPSLRRGLRNIFISINGWERNDTPFVLISLPLKFVELSYSNFLLAMYLIYALPFALLFANFISLQFDRSRHTTLILALPFLILLFAPVLIPLRFGYIDIAGMIPITICLILLIKHDYLRKIDVKVSVWIGLLLLTAVFCRRLYAFLVVGLYPAVFLTNMLYAIKNKSYVVIRDTLINLFVAGIVPLGIMIAFFYPFFEMTVLTDYSILYSSYGSNFSPLLMTTAFIAYFSLSLLITATIGARFFYNKSKSIFCVLLITNIIAVILFLRIQDLMATNHYYLFVPFVLTCFLYCFFSVKIGQKAKIVLFTLFILNFIFVFIINPERSKQGILHGSLKVSGIKPNLNFENIKEHSFSVFSYAKGGRKYRSDIKEIHRLADKLIDLQAKGNKIYTVASSFVFNDGIIKNSKLPDVNSPIHKMLPMQLVDIRDHFPNELFLSNYVVVTSPTQTHLDEEHTQARVNRQQLITYFNDEILSGSLAKHYQNVGKYSFIQGITAYLMEKKSGLSNIEIEKIHNHFKKDFYDHPHMYNVNRTILRTSSIVDGNSYIPISFYDEKTIAIFPGLDRASIIRFSLGDEFGLLSFRARFSNKHEISQQADRAEQLGEVYLSIKNGDSLLKKIYVTHNKDVVVTIPIENIKELTIEVDKGKYTDEGDWFYLSEFQIGQ